MIVVKYASAALLVVIGLVAYTRRDAVLDAYDWDTSIEKSTFPTFDPKTVAEQHRLEVPRSDIEVAEGPDTRQAVLPTVSAPTTTTPVALQGGKTTIAGVVLGPGDTPLPGAVVRIERFEGERSAVLDVTANGNGAFSVGQLVGGRYRVRAWSAPTYAQPGSEVTFIGDGEQRSFRLSLSAPNGVQVSASAATPQIILGQTGSVSATFRREAVTRDGKVSYERQGGQVVTVLGGGIYLGFGATLTSDDSGTVTVPVACNALGGGSFTFSSSGSTSTASVTCIPVPTTTTTTVPPPPTSTPAPGSPVPAAPTPATTA